MYRSLQTKQFTYTDCILIHDIATFMGLAHIHVGKQDGSAPTVRNADGTIHFAGTGHMYADASVERWISA